MSTNPSNFFGTPQRDEGRQEGLAEGKAEVARKMLAAGMPAEQVSEFTGFDAEQLAALK